MPRSFENDFVTYKDYNLQKKIRGCKSQPTGYLFDCFRVFSLLIFRSFKIGILFAFRMTSATRPFEYFAYRSSHIKCSIVFHMRIITGIQ